ncbi:hypothetical protein RRG08_004568 [Elysia crispata]|uniref:Uncharacterized protein n=1 Tax=Elysia crispata TaxID=231223 RepID=A0AAE1E074_9GAST|nr:hypothetical protein RRG08_004568 [Elysia crispata]
MHTQLSTHRSQPVSNCSHLVCLSSCERQDLVQLNRDLAVQLKNEFGGRSTRGSPSKEFGNKHVLLSSGRSSSSLEKS